MTLGRKNSSRLQDTGRILHCLVLDVKFLLGVITGDAPVPNEQFGPNTAWGPPDLHKAVSMPCNYRSQLLLRAQTVITERQCTRFI